MPISNLMSAAMFVCEKLLWEKDDVPSAIRIVDIVYIASIPSTVAAQPALKEGQPSAQQVTFLAAQSAQFFIFLTLKALSRDESEHRLIIQMSNPRGEKEKIFGPQKVKFSSTIADKDAITGLNIAIQLNIGPEAASLGTHILHASIDGEEIAWTPITFRQQQLAQGAH